MSPWKAGDDGPVCSCGELTVVVTVEDGLKALCIVHTPATGLLFELPDKEEA